MWRRAVSQLSKQVPWKSAARHQSPIPAFGSAWQQTFSSQGQQQTQQNPSSTTTTTGTIDAIPGNQDTKNNTNTSTHNTEAAPDLPFQDPESEHIQEMRQYHRFTDIYLGGLWNRLESELGNIENSKNDFDYDVQLTSGCMRVKLPDDAEVIICKDPQEHELKVKSNLLDIYGGGDAEGADPREEVNFKFNDEVGDFVNVGGGGEPLHQFLEAHLEKHLKVELDLEPQPGPHDKVYGADPT